MNELMCSKCGHPAQFKCERCLEPYCSSECQVTDWQDHKAKCYKFPNLIPMNMLKSAVSNLSLNKHECSGNARRTHGSTFSLNDSRRNLTASRSRNPVENGECNGAKPKKLLDDEHFSLTSKTTITATEKRPSRGSSIVNAEKSSNWRVAYPPQNEFFDVMVQFIEEVQNDKRIVWVTDLKYDSALRKLLAEINKNINQNMPCTSDEIYTGALVAAPLGKILYRAEVLDATPESQRATIRLIDYGNELRIPYSQIFPPIPIMSNLNAYAFRVCVPNECGPLEIESMLTIRVVGEKDPQGFYIVECKTKSIPLHLPIDLLGTEPSLTVAKCFSDGRNALLRLCKGGGIEDLDLDAILNSAQTISFEFESIPNEGAFVAARTVHGWRRARLLGFYEKKHQFLVYTIDEGTIGLSPQIKRVPDSFITQPMRVFAISTNSPDYMLSDAMLTTAKKLSLQLLPATNSMTNKDPKAHLPCTLIDDTRRIVDVVIASVFTGSLSELGLKLWHERILEGSNVFVSHVLTYKEIYIASHQTQEYPEIFMSEYQNCLAFAADDIIEKNSVVLFCDPERRKSYNRGEVISCENDVYKILNIDSGYEQLVPRKYLRKPTQLIRSLPVRCTLVKLMFLESIPTPVANNKALEALETCMENRTEFDVTYSDTSNNTIDLLFRTQQKQSLCKKLLPMVFEPRQSLPTSTATQPISTPSCGQVPENISSHSPPNTLTTTAQPSLEVNQPVGTKNSEPLGAAAVIANKTYTLDDLEVIPIVCGDKVPLYVLDPTTIMNLESPHITAADYNNKQFLAKMEGYLRMVGEYCTSSKAPQGGYAPKKMEICLSVFAEDRDWYRALCIDHKPNDTFVVMFLDYGNISKVSKKDIMPMVPELMFPSNANMVYVKDITSKEQAIKFIKQVEANPIIHATVDKLEDDAYVANIHNFN